MNNYLNLYMNLLYVGSMAEHKGVDLLIKALKTVKTEYSLHIVGNGTEEELVKLKYLAKKAGNDKKIKFCGFKQGKELLEEYKSADIFVFPTRRDCFGLVLLEALCAGLPVISSKYADGAYDVIEVGVNGILVDPYNIEEFGKAIEDVLTGKIKLTGKNEALIKKFSFESVVNGYLDAIDYVLKME